MSEDKRYGAPTGPRTPVGGNKVRYGAPTGPRTPVAGNDVRYGGNGSSGGGSSGGNDGFFGNIGNELKETATMFFSNPQGFSRRVEGHNKAVSGLIKTADGTLLNTQNAKYNTQYYRAANQELTGEQQLEARKLGMTQGEYRKALQQQNMMNGYGMQGPQGFGNGQFVTYGQQPYGQQPYGQQPSYYQTPVLNNGVNSTQTNVPLTNNPLPVADASKKPVAEGDAPVADKAKVESKPVAENKDVKPAAALDDADGGKTQTYSFRAKAPKAGEIPNIAKNQVKKLQELLIEAGVNVGPTKADGLYGPNTHYAIQQFAAKLNPPITDLTTIDFTDKNDAERNRFLEALGQGSAPAKQTGLSAEDLAAQKAAEAKKAADDAKKAADANALKQRAEEDARVPESVRNTVFDPRNIATLSQQQRYDLARHSLHGLDELSSEKSRPNFERMHDKMDETVRWVNKHMGTNIPRPSPSDPLSNDAMYALGLRAAYEGKLSTARGEIVQLPQGMTQAAMNAAAVEYIKELDRGVSRDDPRRAIRKFEKEDMGRTGIEVDGLADPQMLEALRQAVAARNGLYTIANAQPVTPPPAETNVKLPDSVVGGTTIKAPQEGPPVMPNAKTDTNGTELAK